MAWSHKHQQEVAKLELLAQELIEMIADTGNDKLMDKFLDWQAQRSKCNESWAKEVITQLKPTTGNEKGI